MAKNFEKSLAESLQIPFSRLNLNNLYQKTFERVKNLISLFHSVSENWTKMLQFYFEELKNLKGKE